MPQLIPLSLWMKWRTCHWQVSSLQHHLHFFQADLKIYLEMDYAKYWSFSRDTTILVVQSRRIINLWLYIDIVFLFQIPSRLCLPFHGVILRHRPRCEHTQSSVHLCCHLSPQPPRCVWHLWQSKKSKFSLSLRCFSQAPGKVFT